MNPILCPHEASVACSARTGCWDDSTKAHIEECVHCREIAEVTEWLGNIAKTEAKECALPNAEQVWMNARTLAVQAAQERALRPLVIAELVVRAASNLALTAGVIWIWFGFQSLANRWLPPVHLHVLQPIFFSAAALAVCLIALVCIKLFQPILAED
jgi:hypothetical protein